MITENIYVKSLTECIDREYKYADFCYSINGVPVYGIIRRYIRSLYCNANGVSNIHDEPIDRKKLLLYIPISLWQITKLLAKKRTYKYFIYSFFRTDQIKEVFIDKFTDPLIDNSDIQGNCIIFEHSKGGGHKRPRIHSRQLIYTDFIDAFSVFVAKCKINGYKRTYKKELNYVWDMLDSILGNIQYDRDFVIRLIVRFCIKAKIYDKIFKKLGVKCMIAPARPVFLEQLYYAKKNGIKVLEVQHGVLSSVGISYSGKIDEFFTPDYFLSYGELHHPEFYGIPKDRIVNIGWALPLYFENITTNKCYGEKDVLVVLNPLTSKYVIEIIMDLASHNTDIVFYLRPHPTEIISAEMVNQIKRFKNIVLQDNSVNFSYVLFLFKNVIGDNSTAINEAFSHGKKVGRLCYPGLIPLYVNKEEEEKTWKIYDDNSFKNYLLAEPFSEINTKVYSVFDRQKFDEFLRGI